MTKKPFITFLLIALILSASVLLFFSARKFDYYSQLKKWPAKSGIVVTTEVVGDRAVMPELSYQYLVDDKLYKGTSDLATPSFGNRKYRNVTAKNVLRAFNQGDSITVYYNPENFAESVLKINPAWSTYMQFGLAIIFQTISLFLLLSAIIPNKNKVINGSSR